MSLRLHTCTKFEAHFYQELIICEHGSSFAHVKVSVITETGHRIQTQVVSEEMLESVFESV